MYHAKLLLAGLLTLSATTTAAMAASTPAAADPAATARCIVQHLPQGAQMFRATDGSLKVVTIGRRGNVARWTISGSASEVHVAHEGGPAGITRAVAGVCY